MPGGSRVLQLPGSEFGAFRWGYTVDPPLPGLIDRPLVTRDLLPLGSPQAMDLLYALDDRFQSGIVEPASIAPVARLLGADTVWATGDAAFDRFRTPRPELVHDLFADDPDGLGDPVAYGGDVVNVPDIAVIDEQSVSDPRVGQPIPPVELVPVDDPVAGGPRQGRRRGGGGQRRRGGRRRGGRTRRRQRTDPLRRLARRRPRHGRRRQPGHRDGHQPGPRPPLAQLAGRRRLHRGRRPAVPRRAPDRPRRRAAGAVRAVRRSDDRRRPRGPGAGASERVR